MSADAGGVRLSKHAPSVWVESQIGNHIAYHAAQAAAMLAALEDAQAYIDSGVVDVARAVGISNRITAALSTLPRAHGGEGGG